MRGSSSSSGPAADPNSLRSATRSTWTHLRGGERTEPAPDWPLAGCSRRERELWERQWRRPQADMWRANNQAEEVAVYVRTLAIAERAKATVSVRTLLRQQQEGLGLNLFGMLRLRWIIDPVGDEAESATDDVDRSSKERLRIVS